VNKEHIM